MNFTVLDRDQYVHQLQAIHALRDALNLSRSDYQSLLERLTGSNSARYMSSEQREHVITFLKVHKALDEAISLAEDARSILNESYGKAPSTTLKKLIRLDGKFEASMNASLEDVMATMRTLHGPEVKLTGVKETFDGSGEAVLELAFEQASVFLLAS